MKTLSTKVFKVNGQFDIHASEATQRTENYADLAHQQGRVWSEMSKRAKNNFRKRCQKNIKNIKTNIETFVITANVPNMFSESQLKEASIRFLINPSMKTLFLECKNGKRGYSTGNFEIN